MRIIDADALLDGEQTIPYPDVPFDVLGKMVDWFVKMVDKQPTIDAVPVVRCGECKHCYAEGFVHEHNVCEKHPELNDIPDNWYCGDGERRANDGTD